jgi:hypothetical protein
VAPFRLEPLPQPLTHAGHLAAAAQAYGLGWQDPARKMVPEAGRVWILPELAARLGLPAGRDRADGEDAFTAALAAAAPFVDAATADGWSVHTRDGGVAPWMEIRRAGDERRATVAWLVLPGLLDNDSLRPPLLAGDPPSGCSPRG